MSEPTERAVRQRRDIEKEPKEGTRRTDVTDTARGEVHLARLRDGAHDILRVRIARRRGQRTTIDRVRLAPVATRAPARTLLSQS